MAKKKRPEVCLSVNGYDVTGDCGEGNIGSAELRFISKVLLEAALAIDAKQHGAIDGDPLVNVGIDCGGPYDEEKGLPVLKRFEFEE